MVRMCVSFCLRFSDLNAILVCFFSCRRAWFGLGFGFGFGVGLVRGRGRVRARARARAGAPA